MLQKPMKLVLAAALLGSFTLVGCKKEVSDNTDTDPVSIETTAAVTEDDAEADVAFDDVYQQAVGFDGDIGLGQNEFFLGAATDGDQTGDAIEAMDPITNRCYTVTVRPLDPTVFPKTVTIDYGTTGCIGRDGRKRTGKIITVYSKRMVVPGAEAVTEFDNYYVNGVKVEGRHVTKNKSTTTALVMSRLVQNGKLTKPNGDYIKWNAEHTNTQVEGLGTPGFPRDDVFKVTGGARGETMRNGTLHNWSRVIVEPLIKAFSCRWFSKGIVKITRNDKIARFNYGDGTCDNKATITVEGISKEITLR